MTFGTRLPLYQGANSGWIAAVVSLTSTPYFQCHSNAPPLSYNDTVPSVYDKITLESRAMNSAEREIEEISPMIFNMSDVELERSIWVPRYQMVGQQ